MVECCRVVEYNGVVKYERRWNMGYGGYRRWWDIGVVGIHIMFMC